MIAAIDMGGTRTKFGLVDQGKVIQASICPADARGSVRSHLDDVLNQLWDMCDRVGISLEKCDGLGLLCTGLVNNREMSVISTNAKYDDAVGFDFQVWARDHAGLALRMENDARGALIGEWRYGAGRGFDNLLMVTIGTGIGTAVISDGKPLVGPHFSGGILGGHLLVRSGGRRCTCGAIGCMESEASGWVLPTLVRENKFFEDSSLHHLEKIDFKTLMSHAASGDGCAVAVRDHCFHIWGEAMVSFIHLFDPERIILGGGIMNDPAPVLASIRNSIAGMAWAESGQIDLVATSHPDTAGLLGAAALFYST